MSDKAKSKSGKKAGKESGKHSNDRRQKAAPQKGEPPSGQAFPAVTMLAAKPGTSVLLLLGFALLLRVWAHTGIYIQADACLFLDLAREIARGDYFQPGYALDQGILDSRRMVPLFSMLIGFLHLLTVPLESGGYFISVVADAASVYFAFRIGMRIAGVKGAWMSGLVVACSFPHLFYSGKILSDSLICMFVLATIDAVMIAGERRSIWAGALVGALAGLSYLTREVGLAVAVLAAATWIVWLIRMRPAGSLKVAAAALACFLAVCAPFWINVKLRTGHFGLSMRGSVAGQFLSAAGVSGAGRADDDYKLTRDQAPKDAGALDALGARLGLFGDLVAAFAPPPWGGKTARLLFFLKALGVGWLLFMAAPYRRRSRLLVFWGAGLFAAHWAFGPAGVSWRYIFPAWSALEVAAATGLLHLPEWLAQRRGQGNADRGRKVVTRGLAGFFILWALSGMWAAGRIDEHGKTVFPSTWGVRVKSLAEEVEKRHELPGEPGVMDRMPHAAYYLDGELIMLPETVEGVNRAVRDRGVDVVVIDSMLVKTLRPKLLPLVSGLEPPAGMHTLIQRYEYRLMKMYTVYVKDGEPGLAEDVSKPAMENMLALGNLWKVRLMGESLLEQAPRDFEVHHLVADLEIVVASTDGVSFKRARRAVETLEMMDPDNPATRKSRQSLEKLRTKLIQAGLPLMWPRQEEE